MIIVRPIEAADMPELQAWAALRGCEIPDGKMRWPHGFVAVDGDRLLMCCWMALLYEVPMAIFDHVYLPRRFGPDETRGAWLALLGAMGDKIREIGKQLGVGYTLLEGHANPVMGPEIERSGGKVSSRQFKKCQFFIPP